MIALENMNFYAYHGFYEEERVIGGNYIVDVFVHADHRQAASADDLYQAINYETIYLIVRQEMQQPTKLIETVAERIMSRLKGYFLQMEKVKVRIRKLHPPLGGSVGSATMELKEDFKRGCVRCHLPMLCYGDATCWCRQKKISADLRSNLQQQFEGCLCADCLRAHGAG